jgi:O-antigen ligase
MTGRFFDKMSERGGASGAAVGMRQTAPLPVLRFVFYLFIFAIPIETLDIGIERGLFSVSHIIGYLFLGIALLQPDVSFRKVPRALWYFSAYGFIFTCLAIFQQPTYTSFWIGNYTSLWVTRLLTLVQMLVLFWVACNLFQDQRLVRGAFLAFGISCVLLSVIQISGRTPNMGVQGRVTALSQDANTLGAVLSLGFLALLGLAYGRNSRDGNTGLLAWVCFGIIATGIVMTGSRGALLSLMVGIIALTARGGQSAMRTKLGFIAVVTITCFAWASYEHAPLRARWVRAWNTGQFAGREQIIPEAWKMFTEKPVAGWGPVLNIVELGRRFEEPSIDTHNLYVWVLTETGLLGSVPFFLGIGLCLRVAWRVREGAEGSLPLALLTCVLMVNMSVTWLSRKQLWLVLAYAVASEQALRRQWPLRCYFFPARTPSRAEGGNSLHKCKGVHSGRLDAATTSQLVPSR